MNKSITLSFAISMLIATQVPVSSQESSTEKLLEKIELLTKENELLNKENALLKKEIAHLSDTDKEKAPPTKANLRDIFIVGAKFSVRSEQVAGPTKGATGTGTMTVTARDGDSFTATNTWLAEKGGAAGSGQIQGKITAPNKMRWKRVDVPNGMEVQATLRPEGSFVDTIGKNANGVVMKGVIDISK